MAVIDDFEVSSEEKKEFESWFQSPQGGESGGSLKKGKIIKINDDFVVVDIGEKSERRLNISEIKGKDGELLFKEGDEIDLLVSRGGISHKKAQRELKIRENIAFLQEKYGENIKDKVIEVTIHSKVKGGFITLWRDDGREIECFLPLRESAMKADAKPSDKPIRVCITRLNDSGISISRKRYFNISDKDKKEKIKEILAGGDILRGEVVSITAFAIFINIDGVEGMIHASELSHKDYANPAQLYKIGDVVEAKVLKFDEAKSKLSLSIKALTKDPWEDIATQLQVGYMIKAIVSSIQPYGAFIDAGNDIEGFLHITEISWEKNIKDPSAFLSVGQEIDVEIIELDPIKKRLRVSLKKLLDKPFMQFAKKHKEGDILSGEIATITDFGAFVRFGNIDGLLHNEDLSWNKKEKCRDKLKIGDKIEVKILKIDREKEKISLSRKALLESPVGAFTKSHKLGDIVKGEVVEIKDFGIFVKLAPNIDALIKNEDLSPLKKEEIKLKDNIEACIAHIDTQNSKIRLSVRRLARKKEQDEIKNYNNDDDKMTLGDILKDRIK